MDKNNDLLYRDLKKAMCSSRNVIISKLFHQDELNNYKRPTTTATQFRQSLANLMNLLASKQPWYIRCIKPNDNQQADQFDNQVVSHQIKYLGLMENLRVRRAGFAYRRNYETFLQRYKCLAPATWPFFDGPAKDGVQVLVDYLGLDSEEYKMGLTKIFIRFPKTIFRIEDAFQQHKHLLAVKMQAQWRGFRQRKVYLTLRKSAILIQKNIRMILAIRALQRKRKAAIVIRNFIKGFITRNDEPNEVNKSVSVPEKKSLPFLPLISFLVYNSSQSGLATKIEQKITDFRSRQFMATGAKLLS